jgi:hypothetical protein
MIPRKSTTPRATPKARPAAKKKALPKKTFAKKKMAAKKATARRWFTVKSEAIPCGDGSFRLKSEFIEVDG